MMEASDSGSRVAVQCHHTAATPTARVYSIAGQTGAVEWYYDLGPGVQAGQGQVQISTDGEWVLFVNEQGKPTPNTAEAFVLDGATGKLRDSVVIPFFITAALSDTGDYLAVGDDPAVHVFKWDSGANKYAAAFDVTPPPGKGAIPWDVQMSTGSDATEMVIVGYIAGDVKAVQVAAWGLESQQLQVNWDSATSGYNTKRMGGRKAARDAPPPLRMNCRAPSARPLSTPLAIQTPANPKRETPNPEPLRSLPLSLSPSLPPSLASRYRRAVSGEPDHSRRRGLHRGVALGRRGRGRLSLGCAPQEGQQQHALRVRDARQHDGRRHQRRPRRGRRRRHCLPRGRRQARARERVRQRKYT